jgi:hypothetical protein
VGVCREPRIVTTKPELSSSGDRRAPGVLASRRAALWQRDDAMDDVLERK